AGPSPHAEHPASGIGSSRAIVHARTRMPRSVFRSAMNAVPDNVRAPAAALEAMSIANANLGFRSVSSSGVRMKLVEPIAEFHDDIRALRRDLHAHPELKFEEVRTSDRVADRLAEWGIPVQRGLARTGVVGIVKG